MSSVSPSNSVDPSRWGTGWDQANFLMQSIRGRVSAVAYGIFQYLRDGFGMIGSAFAAGWRVLSQASLRPFSLGRVVSREPSGTPPGVGTAGGTTGSVPIGPGPHSSAPHLSTSLPTHPSPLPSPRPVSESTPPVESSLGEASLRQILDRTDLTQDASNLRECLDRIAEGDRTFIYARLNRLLENHRMQAGMPRADRRRARLQSEMQNLKTALREKFQALGLQLKSDTYDADELELFEVVRRHVQNERTSREEQEGEARHQLIQRCYPGVSIDGLSPHALEELYQRCLEESRVVEEVQTKFTHLIERSNLPEGVRPSYAVQVRHAESRTAESPPKFILRAEGPLLLGYSLYSCLRTNQLITAPWNGEQEFLLSLDQLKQMQAYLRLLKDWHADFEQIFGDLLDCEELDPYLSVAQKKVSEIVRDLREEQEERRESQPRIDYRMRSTLETLDQESPCILFDQLSINLTDHPERDFLKQQIEGFYRHKNMTGFNGKPKQFLLHDPFRTNLNRTQVLTIAPLLNRHLKLQQELKPYTEEKRTLGTQLAELRSFDSNYNPSTVFSAYLQGTLTRTFQDMVPSQFRELHVRQIEQGMSGVLPAGEAGLDEAEGRADAVRGKFLADFTLPRHSRPAKLPEPTDRQKEALYGGALQSLGPAKQCYPHTDEKHVNVAILFWRLKQTPLVQQMISEYPNQWLPSRGPGSSGKWVGFEASLDELQRSLESRIETFHTLPEESVYFSKKSIRESLSYLETYVCKVVYQNSLQITEASIQASLRQLVAQQGEDLNRGCARGLAGRVNSLLVELTSSVNDDVDACLQEKQKQCLTAAFQERFGGDAHNSHYGGLIGEVDAFLGISQNASGRRYDQLSPEAQQLCCDYLNAYTPKAAYDAAFELMIGKFALLNRENETEKLYQLFKDLGFSESREALDATYRVQRGQGWQIAYIAEDLHVHLGRFLLEKGYLLDRSTRAVTEVAPPAARRTAPVRTPPPPSSPAGAGQALRTDNAGNFQRGSG